MYLSRCEFRTPVFPSTEPVRLATIAVAAFPNQDALGRFHQRHEGSISHGTKVPRFLVRTFHANE